VTSKGGAKVEVTEYFMSQHFGVCTIVDGFKRIYVKEKLAWEGYVTARSSIAIQEDELFGGNKKEGGVAGTIYFLPGRGDQLLYDELANRLRAGATGADVPAYRGLASVFFTGRPDAHKGRAGFYWTANNPYLPGVWVTVERAPVGLDPSIALIPRPGYEAHPTETQATSQSNGSAFVFSSGWLAYYTANTIQWYDLSTREPVGTSSLSGTFGTTTADLGADGTFYMYGSYVSGLDVIRALWSCPPAGTSSRVDVDDFGSGSLIRTRALGTSVLCSTNALGYLDGTVFVPTTQSPRDFCLDDAGDRWAVTQPSGSSNQFGLLNLETGALTVLTGSVTRGGLSSAHLCFVTATASFFVVTDGKFYIIPRATMTIGSTDTAVWGSADLLPAKNPERVTFFHDFDEYSLVDGSFIRTVSGWTGVPATHRDGFDYTNNAIVSRPQFDAELNWLFLDPAGDRDANPAHIIYEALTNTDWGMGSPTTLIDVGGFGDVAQVLYDEPLGLSLLWLRQTTIQDFIQEVLDHIQGVLFVDPQTGLLTLKLIRGDYDVGTLPTISPSTAQLRNFNRKLWGEIVNEISVTWTNPENEQDETVTAHDLASITTQGGIVSDSRNYYGVRYSALAARLAARDLRSAGAPLATCEAEVDRSLWALRPASVLLVDWPEHGLDGVVMRVTSIDYGKPGDPAIKLALIEDVFGLDVGDYVTPPGSALEDTAAAPSAMTEQQALTLPYYLAFNAVNSIDGATYPEVLAGALGATTNADVYGFELWGEVTLSDGTTEWQSLATLNVSGRAELAGGLDAEASSTGVTFTAFVGSLLPSTPGFAIIGSGTEPDDEIALISSAGSTYTLSRGVLDTVPKAWPAGTPVWFIDSESLIEDNRARSSGETVTYRLRTRTSQGLLSLFSAPELTYTLSDRPWLPSRPANLAIGGVQFNDLASAVNMIGAATIAVTWSNRNRLTEDNLVLGWTDSTVTPETGQTTTLTVYKIDGTTVLATHTGLTGTSYNVPVASFGSEAFGIVVATAARTDADGTFDSLQGHGIYVQVDMAAPVGMATETDTALALGSAIVTGAGRANETDSALSLARSAALPVGMATATNTALALTAAATDPSFANTVLLLSGDGVDLSTGPFTDESAAAHGNATNSAATVKVSTVDKVFGTGSMRFGTGSATSLTYSDHADWTLGASDFTIEMFVQLDDGGTIIFPVSHYNATGNQRAWLISFGGTTFQFQATASGSVAATVIATETFTPTNGAWYYICAERSGNTFRLYRGTPGGTASMVASGTNSMTIFDSTATLRINGVNGGGGTALGMFIDELRITKNTARYNTNTSYPVPTAAFPRS
jgi:hypothetical protein